MLRAKYVSIVANRITIAPMTICGCSPTAKYAPALINKAGRQKP